jgi:hypothetical protein
MRTSEAKTGRVQWWKNNRTRSRESPGGYKVVESLEV